MKVISHEDGPRDQTGIDIAYLEKVIDGLEFEDKELTSFIHQKLRQILTVKNITNLPVSDE